LIDNAETAASTTISSPYAGLGESEKRVLHFAASMGLEFDWSVLKTATEMEEEPLAESLERLVHLGTLKELNWGDSYAFVRVVTLAQAYSEISSSRLRVIHKKIAEAYEKLYPDPTPKVIPEMGRQFYLGRVHEKSRLYNRYAAALAIRAFSPDVAIHYLERALEDIAALPGDHRVEEADVLKEIGDQYDAMGDDEKAEGFYTECLKKLPEEEKTLRALLLLSRAEAAHELNKLGLVRQYCEEAIKLFERVGHKKGLAIAHFILGRAGYTEGALMISKRETEAALRLFDPERDAREVARCYINLGNISTSVNDPKEIERGIQYFRKAIRILETIHDYRILAKTRNNLAVTIEDTQPREAMEELIEARACAERAKDERFLGWILFNTVEVHLMLGQEEEAIKCNNDARKILSKLNDLIGMQQVTMNDGILAQRRKAYEEAEKAYLDSFHRAEHLDYPVDMVEVLMHLTLMYEDWGKKAYALRVVSQIKDIGEDRFTPMKRPTYEALKKRLGV
jgi:tetratricopeptide (TPR) repeat protein